MTRIDAERARRLAWLALWIYIAGLGLSAILRVQGDFFVYYRTGHRVLHGLAIYPPDESDRFLYAPIFAIAFAPFALLPRHAAQGLWFVFNAWGLVAFIIGAGVMLFGRSRQLSAALVAVPIVLLFRLIGNNIEHGQINLPVLALCVWSIVYAREERPTWSGAMIAAAVLIKPFAILAAIYLVLRRNWAVLAWAMVAGVAFFVLPVAVFGPRGLVEQTVAYLHSVASMTDRYRTMLTNQSAVAAVARLTVRFGDEVAADGATPFWIGMAFEAALIAAVSLGTLRATPTDDGNRTAADRYALAGFFCLMAGFAPISWKSYFAAMVVAYMLIVDDLWERGVESRFAWTLFIVSAALNFAPGRYLNRVALFYSAHLLSSILALGAIVVLSFGKDGSLMASREISAQAEHAS
ncbi:MAG: glycosyltransferase family 87 protein [Candidatus Binataceae bacterium]